MSVPGTDGKRKTATFKTKTEARAWIEETRMAARQGRLTTAKSQTTRKYLDSWLQMKRHSLRPRTHESYELNVRRLTPYIGHIRLDALRPSQVQECYTKLLDSGLAPRSVRQVHVVLHKALNDALRQDLVPRNVADGATPPRAPRTEMKTLSVEEVNRLWIATQGDRFHAMWVLLPMTGLRIGEARAPRWSDIDLDKGRLVVNRSVQAQKGQGEVFVEPKTGKGRTVELADVVVQALQGHADREEFAGGKKLRTSDALVFRTATGQPVDYRRVYRNWSAALKKAGLPHVGIHALRHTAASLMLQQGEHPKVVAEMLGHASVGITLDLYSHVAPTMQREAVNRLDALLQGDRVAFLASTSSS